MLSVVRAVIISFLLLLLASFGQPLHAQSPRYWNTNYDSLRHALRRVQADTARLRRVVHLLDLVELTDAKRREEALPLLDELLSLNQRLHQLDDAPYRQLQAGVAHWVRGEHTPALAALQQAIALFDQAGHPIPRLLIDLAPLYNALGQSDPRYAYFSKKLSQYNVHGPMENTAACYLVLAGSYRHRGDLNRAISHYLHAADLFKHFDRGYYVNELMVTGSAYAEWGNIPRALKYLRRAMALEDIYGNLGIRRFYTVQALSRVYMEQQNYAQALDYADQALEAARKDTVLRPVATAYGLVLKSTVLVHLNRAPEAYPMLVRAQQLADSLRLGASGRLGEFPLEAAWAHYYAARGDDARAEHYWLTAYQRATVGKLNSLRPKWLRHIIQFYEERRQPQQVLRYTRAYIDLMDSLNAVQGPFLIAQYEGERIERAQNARILNLRQAQAVQALRLKQRSRLLWGALVAIGVISVMGAVLYRQLRINKRTLAELRRTQSELVASEKWAFVGEVSAGIAHELQNPLNFMKRFAEVSTTLIDGMDRQPGNGRDSNTELQQEILTGLKQNLQEISQHGMRASSIIRDMLEHSRSGTGQRQPTDVNALTQEYLRLAYEGTQAQDPNFQAQLDLALAADIPRIQAVPHDIGRVLLNLFTNAFYAVNQRRQTAGPDYRPQVQARTRWAGNQLHISIRDNGTGMPEHVQEQVFQPFFTTKPPGEGTGLGLSLSYDIVTKGHGGTITVESREGEFTEFVITLPA